MIPTIFIGSSVEGKDVADALQVGLKHDARCKVWHQAFPLSQNTIDTLLKSCAANDFAIFVFSPDDLSIIRKQQYAVARDNVLFEAGLFMGVHGKERGFIVTPLGSPSFHVPTDLLGFTTATYDAAWAKTDPLGATGAAVTEIRLAIRNSSWSLAKLDITCKAGFSAAANMTFPLKLSLSFQNNRSVAVALESNGFEFHHGVPPAPKAELTKGGTTYKFQFLTGRDSAGKDIYAPKAILEPGRSLISWIPIDPAFGQTALDASIRANATGTLRYRCVWLETPPTSQEYEDQF